MQNNPRRQSFAMLLKTRKKLMTVPQDLHRTNRKAANRTINLC